MFEMVKNGKDITTAEKKDTNAHEINHICKQTTESTCSSELTGKWREWEREEGGLISSEMSQNSQSQIENRKLKKHKQKDRNQRTLRAVRKRRVSSSNHIEVDRERKRKRERERERPKIG